MEAESPLMVLDDMEAVRQFLSAPADLGTLGKYHVKSVWLIGVIDSIAAEGKYPYNADVKRRAEAALGLPASEYGKEGDALSVLVYNAQKYRHREQRAAAGYRPLDDAMLQEAFAAGLSIEILGSNILGGDAPYLVNVRRIGGVLYAMQPRKRKYAVRVSGQPARLVAHAKSGNGSATIVVKTLESNPLFSGATA